MRCFLGLLAMAMILALAQPAGATIVYVRPASARSLGSGAIVVAHNDGSASRVIASGEHPIISPDGRHVAFFTRRSNESNSLRLISVQGGRSRLLVANTFIPGPGPPLAWSPDSRRLVAGAGNSSGAFIVEVRRHVRRFIGLGDGYDFEGATFSADGRRIVFDAAMLRGPGALLLLRPGGHTPEVAAGSVAVWVRAGIVYSTKHVVHVLRRPGARSRILYRSPSQLPGIFVISGSSDGRTVVAAQTLSDTQVQAVLIGPQTKVARPLSPVFSEIDGVSRHGERVLGVVGGNVVSVGRDGRTSVLAPGAISPSWNA